MNHQKVIKIKSDTERSKNISKYAPYKKVSLWPSTSSLHVAFTYVDPEIMPVEDKFPSTRTFVVKYKKIPTPRTFPKHLSGFIYMSSEDYEIDQNFYDKYVLN